MSNTRKPEHNFAIGSESFILDEKYLLSFSHFDGFTPELLSIDLFVDTFYRFELFISAFGKIPGGSGDQFEIYLEGNLPDGLKQKLVHLLSKDLTNIKDDYNDEHPGASGGASQFYALNAKLGFRKVILGVGCTLAKSLIEFKIEELFFEFNRELNLWLKFSCEMSKKTSSWSSNEE